MSDNHKRDTEGGQMSSQQHELLTELDSLHKLLHEEHEPSEPVTSIDEIRSVREYMALKQEADKEGMELDAWLARRAAEQQKVPVEKPSPATDAEDIPLLEEAVPMPDEEVSARDNTEVPVLDEVIMFDSIEENPVAADAQNPGAPRKEEELYAAAAAALQTPGTRLEQIEALVEQLIDEKLQAIKPQLKKQIFDEIRGRLPVDQFN